MKNFVRSASTLVGAVLCLLLFSSGAAASDDLAPFTDQEGALRIAGGTAHIPVMKEAAKQIINTNSKIQISIAGGGSGLGIKQAGEGLVDIGNTGRKPTDEEVEKFGLTMLKWAVDGVAAVVHPSNSVQRLSSEQLQEVFAGKITNWKELGGEDQLINLYTRDEASGTRKVFWSKALGKGTISNKANVVVSNGAMKTTVAGDPAAIGYVSVGHIDSNVAPLSLDGVTPTLETVQNGSYTVARGLYSVTKGEASGLAKLFLDFIISPTGQKIVAEKGFIPVK